MWEETSKELNKTQFQKQCKANLGISDRQFPKLWIKGNGQYFRGRPGENNATLVQPVYKTEELFPKSVKKSGVKEGVKTASNIGSDTPCKNPHETNDIVKDNNETNQGFIRSDTVPVNTVEKGSSDVQHTLL